MTRRLLLIGLLSLTSCSTVYYGAMEKIGFQKRDILVKRVVASKNSQQNAKKEFSSALEEFLEVTEVSPGKLEAQYKKVNSAYLDAKGAAENVKAKNDNTERVAKALFKEWKKEIGLFENTELKRESQKQFDASKRRYTSLMATMRKAERRLDPVLRQFRDQTLFLKHNLNARAIAALEPKAAGITADVSRLIEDMNRSIAEAEQFISAMKN